jgi:hypothetical protein
MCTDSPLGMGIVSSLGFWALFTLPHAPAGKSLPDTLVPAPNNEIHLNMIKGLTGLTGLKNWKLRNTPFGFSL